MKLLEADRALVKIPALTMEGRTKRRGVSRDPRKTVSQILTLDPGALHGNDVGALSSSSGWSKKVRIVGRDGRSDNQSTTNVKQKNTPEYTADSPNDVATRTLCLRSSATVVQPSQRSMSDAWVDNENSYTATYGNT